MIKNIKPDYKSKFHQSYYIPLNESKFIGSYPIICRSMMEKQFCLYLDNTNEILSWDSESFSIKYINKWDNKQHRYYPDFIFKTKTDTVIVEVKPIRQLSKPKEPKIKTKKAIKNYNTSLKMYVTNVSKIEAIKKYAIANNYKFILITENELKQIKTF